MDSRQLKHFREIVEHGSMSGAARSIGIAQPSLSLLVRNLEAMLQTELLVRTARGVSTTEAGDCLYRHACRIEEQIDAARNEVLSIGSDPSGRVAFGMTPSVSMALSIPMAETLRLEMPKLRFTATEAMSGHLRDWVMSGEIDLALLYDNTDLGTCASSLLMTEDLWFYSAAEDWPFEPPPGVPVDLAEALRCELVLPSARHGLRNFVDRIARTHRLEVKVAIEMDSLPQIKALVARGSGYTILSPAAVHDLVADGGFVGSPLINPRLRRHIYLVRSANSPVTLAIRRTEETCREVVADLVARGIWQAEVSAGV